MPFTIHNLKLPFLKISKSPKAGRSFVWHAGPWQYNTRTGQHTLKLSRSVKYSSRNRTQRAAAKRKRAAARATERAGWDTYFAAKGNGAPTPPPPRPARKNTKKKPTPKKRTTAPTRTRQAATPPATAPTTATPSRPAPTPTPTPAAPITTAPAPKPAKPAPAAAPARPTRIKHVASGNDRIDSQIGQRIERQVGSVEYVGPGDDVPPGGQRTSQHHFGHGHVTMIATGNATVGEQNGFVYGDRAAGNGYHDPAQQCWQTTADGSPCQRLGTCPPGTHHPRRRTTGQKGKR
jgi:hypothetical protein